MTPLVSVTSPDTIPLFVVITASIVVLLALIIATKVAVGGIDGATIFWITVSVTLGCVILTHVDGRRAVTEAMLHDSRELEHTYGVTLVSGGDALPTVPRTSRDVLINRGGDLLDCTVSVDASRTYVVMCRDGKKVVLLEPAR